MFAGNHVKSKSTLNRDEHSPHRDSPFHVGRRLQSRGAGSRDWREYLPDILVQPAHVATRPNRRGHARQLQRASPKNMTARPWSSTLATSSTYAASPRRFAGNPLPHSEERLSALWPLVRNISFCIPAHGAASRARKAWRWLQSRSPRQQRASNLEDDGLPNTYRKHCRRGVLAWGQF